MPTISEDQLASWTQPAYGNEEEKAEATERTIREAIQKRVRRVRLITRQGGTPSHSEWPRTISASCAPQA